MAEAEGSSGGGGVSAGFVILVLIVFFILWLRQGGLHNLTSHPIDFGWRPAATSSGPFPFAPNFQNLAPHIPVPDEPQGPDPYNQ